MSELVELANLVTSAALAVNARPNQTSKAPRLGVPTQAGSFARLGAAAWQAFGAAALTTAVVVGTGFMADAAKASSAINMGLLAGAVTAVTTDAYPPGLDPRCQTPEAAASVKPRNVWGDAAVVGGAAAFGTAITGSNMVGVVSGVGTRHVQKNGEDARIRLECKTYLSHLPSKSVAPAHASSKASQTQTANPFLETSSATLTSAQGGCTSNTANAAKGFRLDRATTAASPALYQLQSAPSVNERNEHGVKPCVVAVSAEGSPLFHKTASATPQNGTTASLPETAAVAFNEVGADNMLAPLPASSNVNTVERQALTLKDRVVLAKTLAAQQEDAAHELLKLTGSGMVSNAQQRDALAAAATRFQETRSQFLRIRSQALAQSDLILKGNPQSKLVADTRADLLALSTPTDQSSPFLMALSKNYKASATQLGVPALQTSSAPAMVVVPGAWATDDVPRRASRARP